MALTPGNPFAEGPGVYKCFFFFFFFEVCMYACKSRVELVIRVWTERAILCVCEGGEGGLLLSLSDT